MGKCDHKIVKWENLKVFAITKVTHARIYVYVDERKNTTTMSHRNENFYKFLEDVRENANMLKPYYDEKNSFEKKSVSITRAYWRKKSREWKWLRVTAAYCKKKLTVNFIWDNFYLFFKWRANNFLSWDFSAGKALQLLLINEQILIFLFIIQTIIDKCVAINSRLLLETSTASIFYFCSISKAHFVYFSQIVGSSAVKI